MYKVLVEKEFYPLSKDRATIGLLMMVKNEEARIEVSLASVADTVDCVIIFDTGSTDNTVKIISDFCDKRKINYYISEGVFTDFSTSRNISLDYADKISPTYVLVLDSNDELRGGPTLKKLAKTMYKENTNAFMLCQTWYNGGSTDKYFNIRFVKTNCGWRYRGSVHEWFKDTTVEGSATRYPVFRVPDNVVLYQDRTKDNGKSQPRFARDRELLLKDFREDPKNGRTLFYLAQTCMCIGDREEAMYYSKLRLEVGEFEEERFLSMMRIGDCSQHLGHPWDETLKWYMKAYEHTQRAEPLVKIADHYRLEKKYYLACMFIKEACELAYPEHLILFVDRAVYDYYRWHVAGAIYYYIGKYEEGIKACKKAIEAGVNKEVDEKNLQHYLVKKSEITTAPPPTDDKNEFMKQSIVSLQEKFPRLPPIEIQKRAEVLWKSAKKKLKKSNGK